MNSYLTRICTQKTGASFSPNPEDENSDEEIISRVASRSY